MKRKGERMEEVLALLREKGRTTTGEVAEELGITPQQARNILYALVVAGVARKVRRGLYEYQGV